MGASGARRRFGRRDWEPALRRTFIFAFTPCKMRHRSRCLCPFFLSFSPSFAHSHAYSGLVRRQQLYGREQREYLTDGRMKGNGSRPSRLPVMPDMQADRAAEFTLATVIEATATQGVYRVKPDFCPPITVNLSSTLWDLERKNLPLFQGVDLLTGSGNATGSSVTPALGVGGGTKAGAKTGGGGSSSSGNFLGLVHAAEDDAVELLTTAEHQRHLNDWKRFHYDPLTGVRRRSPWQTILVFPCSIVSMRSRACGGEIKSTIQKEHLRLDSPTRFFFFFHCVTSPGSPRRVQRPPREHVRRIEPSRDSGAPAT